ncbi:MAG: anthrone oxygenase family protein [Gemmatimonadota bacterium]
MLLKAWRFITIMLTAVLMTMGFTHLWQLPQRLSYDGFLWLETLTFYVKFGPQGPGPVIEIAALLSTIVLVFLTRDRRPARALTLMAAVALAASTALWWTLIYPVNRELLTWTAETLPQNWTDFREQWEYTHSARAALMFVALGCLVYAAVHEAPDHMITRSELEE